MDGLKDALVGTSLNNHGNEVAAYSYVKIIQVHIANGMSQEEAQEWHSYNTERALLYIPKENRPIVVFDDFPWE